MLKQVPPQDPQAPKEPHPRPFAGSDFSSQPFKVLPVPTAEAARKALDALGLHPLGEIQLVAEVSTRLIIPVVTAAAGADGKSSTRYAALLADDQTVMVRLMTKALRYLHEGWIPTREQAYALARRRKMTPDLPLPDLKSTARIQAHCMAELSGTCRKDESITVERARQLIRIGQAYVDDEHTLQRICGECSRLDPTMVAQAQAKVLAAATHATNPTGTSDVPKPPGLEALRASLPDFAGTGLACIPPPDPEEPPRVPVS
ncbi:MAG: hypothetical protein H6Q00_3552, partial [Holophagaceae bacterium]|nr:hypothetical protein [Holophagaceae bacterium]